MDRPEISCQAQLEQQVIVSNYRETECPDLKLEPKELLVRDIDRGLIPYELPVWEGEQGDRVLTIRRIGYVLVVQTYLHDLGRILENLRVCDLIQETPTTEQFAHIHDAHVAECMESCAGFSRDRSRRVVLGFTNPRPSLENRALENSRSSFADQLQQICGIACLTFQLARLLPDYDLFADSVLVAHLGRRKDASGKSRT
jgi:hypothetical protein